MGRVNKKLKVKVLIEIQDYTNTKEFYYGNVNIFVSKLESLLSINFLDLLCKRRRGIALICDDNESDCIYIPKEFLEKCKIKFDFYHNNEKILLDKYYHNGESI
jgi:hypothetical protein